MIKKEEYIGTENMGTKYIIYNVNEQKESAQHQPIR